MSPRVELSGKRPSPLSPVFREWAKPGGPLAEWTRHIDGDWCWYCPICFQVVVLIEEKTERSPAKAWNVTRRLATRHEDRPWGLRVTCLDDGQLLVTRARNRLEHKADGEQRITREQLLSWITQAFEQHYAEQGHRRAA